MYIVDAKFVVMEKKTKWAWPAKKVVITMVGLTD